MTRILSLRKNSHSVQRTSKFTSDNEEKIYIIYGKCQKHKKKDKKTIKLRFIDSYKFLNISFDKLVSFVSKDKAKNITMRIF